MNLNPRIPKIDENFDLKPWGQDLLDLIPEKIEEQLEVMDEAEKERDEWYVTITQARSRGQLDNFALWFWLLWTESRFSRYDQAQKWLRYWLDLYQAIPIEKKVEVRRPQPPKNQVDTEWIKKNRLIEDYYTDQLRSTANRLCGKCPFHQEDSASFFIFTDDNHFHCFGCGEHGDVINYIMKLKDYDFKQAVEYLK